MRASPSVVGLAIAALASVACAETPRTLPACQASVPDVATAMTDAGESVGVAAPDPVLLAAGDIAVCGEPGAERTAKLLDRMEGTIAALGDNVYESGSLDEYLDCYEPTWGRHRHRTRPAVGNHEYRTPHAGAYFAYFCGAAGEPFKGWYSYELGAWHVVVLNSNCGEIDGCDAGSEQERWLREDLERHPARCTVAYWHHPRFSSGEHGNAENTSALWQALHDHGAEIVLTGHEHDYERFAPQSASGALDETRGIREFVIGTGGRSARAFAHVQPNSEVRRTGELGVLALELHDGNYDWRFVREDGHVVDSGHGECH